MVIFRENTEDVYAGLEVEAGTPEAGRLAAFLHDDLGWDIRPDSGIGIKPISEYRFQAPRPGRGHLRREARPGQRHPRPQGQHPEVHRRGLPQLGLRARAGGVLRRGRRLGRLRRQAGGQGPGQGHHRRHHPPAGPDPPRRVRRHRHHQPERRLSLRRPGGPGGGDRHRAGWNINYVTGHGVFEATHGTAPKYAGLDKVNPGGASSRAP